MTKAGEDIDIVYLDDVAQKVQFHKEVSALVKQETAHITKHFKTQRPSYLPPESEPGILLEKQCEKNLSLPSV